MRKFVWNVAHYERYGEDMFKGVRPFDWLMLVVEILVLVLIAGEVIAAILRWRQKRYATAHIREFLDDGQKLQDVVPGRAASDDEVNAWVGEVKNGYSLSNPSLRELPSKLSLYLTITLLVRATTCGFLLKLRIGSMS